MSSVNFRHRGCCPCTPCVAFPVQPLSDEPPVVLGTAGLSEARGGVAADHTGRSGRIYMYGSRTLSLCAYCGVCSVLRAACSAMRVCAVPGWEGGFGGCGGCARDAVCTVHCAMPCLVCVSTGKRGVRTVAGVLLGTRIQRR